MEYFKQKLGRMVHRHAWPVAILAIPAFYLFYCYFHSLTCSSGLMSCGLQDYGLILPFYILVIPFVIKLNLFSYTLLFLLSFLVYLASLYYLATWVEQFSRYHKKEHFGFKQTSII